MHRPSATLGLVLVVMSMAACQTHADKSGGSLAQLKRTQESRVMFDCIKENSAIVHGDRNLRGYSGLNLDLIDACREYADASVW